MCVCECVRTCVNGFQLIRFMQTCMQVNVYMGQSCTKTCILVSECDYKGICYCQLHPTCMLNLSFLRSSTFISIIVHIPYIG